MRKLYLVLFCMILTSGCVTPLSSMQRRAIESRDLEGTYEDAFKATLQVLQDYGYIIKNTDYDSGVVQGQTGIKKSWVGIMTNLEITATLEQFGQNTVRQRLSLIKTTKQSSQYGTQEDSHIIQDPELFQRIYDDIQKEMFVRKNLRR